MAEPAKTSSIFSRSAQGGDLALSHLENQVLSNMQARLQSMPDYTITEINHISNFNHRLFLDPDLELSEQVCEELRALSKLSQTELKPARSITSHRPLIGPLIIFFKRLTWPLIQVHLKEVFNGIAEFESRAVQTIARQQAEIIKLQSRATNRINNQ